MCVFDSKDKDYMRLALLLAQKGKGYVLPNPLVGAVLVKDSKIVGQGYHKKYGDDHAEVNALREAGERAEGATLYVTLEPCSHFGQTPPCVDRILDAKIRRVVVAMQDPNPLVSGKGMAKLRVAGVPINVGLLEEEAMALNRPFVKYITKGLPFVTLKIAQTLDGRIADRHGKSKWITSEEARKLVHRWRFEAGAVLVGIATVLADDPRLTVRHVKGKQPFRIVLDSHLSMPLNSRLLSDEFIEKTIIIARSFGFGKEKEKAIRQRGARVLKLPCAQGAPLVPEVLAALHEIKIAHILVEGGAAIFSSFIKQKCADHLCLFMAGKMFGEGKCSVSFPDFSAAKSLNFKATSWRRVGEDMLFEADFDWESKT